MSLERPSGPVDRTAPIALPDLLHPEPQQGLDLRALRQTLTFAFAAGGGSDAFDEVVDRARVPPSSWDPECFADDLFLGDFVKRCMPVSIDGQRRLLHAKRLVRLLSQPGGDPGVIEHRQRVFRELGDRPELRRALEDSWLETSGLLQQLQAAELRGRLGPIRRRLEILRTVKSLLDKLAIRFVEAESPLGRLSHYAERVRQTDGYRQLAEVLDYDGHLATVDLEVKVGHDGEIRSFAITRLEENRENRFHVPPLRRFLTRLLLFFRGYHLRQNEILGRLVNAAFDGVTDVVIALIAVLSDIEFYLAGLGFKALAEGRGLSVCLPEVSAGPADTAVKALFNPFLLHQERPVRPCDLAIPERALVVVTGPNSGGKTRLLQALGLTQLLAQTGCFVPATHARLRLRNGIFVSLIEPQSSDQEEGRLGSELLRIRRLFQKQRLGGLVIVDELCSGTNPSEGEEIFELVIGLLDELEPQAFVITHFLRLAADLERRTKSPRLRFLQVELDQHERPTYGFVPGVATTSLARNTAERLGVTREALEGLVAEAKRSAATGPTEDAGAAPALRAIGRGSAS